MKYKTLYVCEICGQEFDLKSDALICEANCHGLTVENYQEWHRLNDAADEARYEATRSCNSATRQQSLLACNALVDFERAHHLEWRPTYWADNL